MRQLRDTSFPLDAGDGDKYIQHIPFGHSTPTNRAATTMPHRTELVATHAFGAALA